VAAHAPAARTLRLLGARDGFIAAGFVRPLARRVALAAAAGTAVGLAILATLPAGAEAGFFLVGLGPRGLDWLFPLAVAPAAAAIAWAAAALAARRALRRWS
jgi:cell division transport system permease protein